MAGDYAGPAAGHGYSTTNCSSIAAPPPGRSDSRFTYCSQCCRIKVICFYVGHSNRRCSKGLLPRCARPTNYGVVSFHLCLSFFHSLPTAARYRPRTDGACTRPARGRRLLLLQGSPCRLRA